MWLIIHALTLVVIYNVAKLLLKLEHVWVITLHIEGLVQDCRNSSALAMELLQCFTKPSIYDHLLML